MIFRNHSFIAALIFLILCGTADVPRAGAAVQDIELTDITPRALLSHSAIDLGVTENEIITLGAGNRLLNLYDIKDIVNPRRVSILELPAEAKRICTGESAAYVICPDIGLLVIDLGNPVIPRLSEIY